MFRLWCHCVMIVDALMLVFYSQEPLDEIIFKIKCSTRLDSDSHVLNLWKKKLNSESIELKMHFKTYPS